MLSFLKKKPKKTAENMFEWVKEEFETKQTEIELLTMAVRDLQEKVHMQGRHHHHKKTNYCGHIVDLD